MGLFREKPETFVEFHTQAKDIAALKQAVAKQQTLNKAILAYIEADVAATWMPAANELIAALRESLK